MFKNPIQTQTAAGASAPVVQPSQSAEVAIGGVSSLLGFFQDYQEAEAAKAVSDQPQAWVVKEEWESEGADVAIQLAKEYKTKRETEGSARANAWLNVKTLELQQGLGATAQQSFRSTLQANLGKNPLVNEIEAEQSRENTRKAKLDEYELAGRELFAAQAVKLGVDPSAIDTDTAIGLAMTYNGQKSIATLESSQNAVIIQQQGMVDRERKLTSQASAVNVSADLTNRLRSTSIVLAKGIAANPNNAVQLKSQAIALLQQEKAQLQNQVAQAVQAAGGNVADVDNSLLNGLVTQYDAVINTLNGTDDVKILQNQLEGIALGTTLNAVPRLPTKTQQFLLINSSLRSPNGFVDSMLGNLPAANANPNMGAEVIANLPSLGAAAAGKNTGVPVNQSYGLVGTAMKYAVDKAESRLEAAQMFINTLSNSFNANRSVRKDANSANGLPVLMNEIARDSNLVNLAPEIQKAAEEEGTTVEDMFTSSLTTMFRESVYPSLSISDPYVVPNLNIEFSGGKFKVSLNEESYYKQSGKTPNISNFSGRDIVATGLNQRLKKMESVLNTSLLSYKNVGGNPEDLGAALKYQLEVAAGISRLKNQETTEPVQPVTPQE